MSCTNEYRAIGGRDSEDDRSFKLRITSLPNLQAIGTLDYMLEILKLYNSNILRIFNLGINDNSQIVVGIVMENGSFLTDTELAELEENIRDYFSLLDTALYEGNLNFELSNITYHSVGGDAPVGSGIDFRVDILTNYNVEDVRRDIQVNISKYLDFRYWDINNKVEWDDLLMIVKNTKGVRYVPDEYFLPHSDENLTRGSLPRVTGFIMRDLDGNILYDAEDSALQVFYSNEA